MAKTRRPIRTLHPRRQVGGVLFCSIVSPRHVAEHGVAYEGLWDMLRYDTAFMPTDGRAVVAFPTFKTSDGYYGGTATYRRWESFLIGLKACEAPMGWSEQHPDDLTAWVTYKHPRVVPGDKYSPTDYGKLASVSLAEYLAEVE